MTGSAGPDLATAPPRSAQAHATRNEMLLARAAVLFRAGAIAQMAFALVTAEGGYRSVRTALVLAAVVTAESAAVAALWWWLRRIETRLLTADVVFCTLALIVEAGMTTAFGRHTWAFYMYPFTLVSCVAVGAGYLSLRGTLATTSALGAGYVLATVVMQSAPLWNTAPNALSYYANTVITWVIARELRRQGRAADTAESAALARAADLAAEREAARFARALHDRVLQTMEMLASGRWIAEPKIRAHVAGEAVWLRDLVSGARPEPSRDILAALRVVVRDQALRGMRVELNGVGLLGHESGQPMPVETIDAVCGAVREAVTNAGKHAGVDTVVVRAAFDHGGEHLVVSIVDHGVGFDPSTETGAGLGLRRSVHDPVVTVGGSVQIDSAFGAGTYIELRVPVPHPGSRSD